MTYTLRAQKMAGLLFPVLFLGLIWIPASVFFQVRGGLTFLQGLDFKTASSLLFPLVGLYAYFFVWVQFMLGTNMRWLRDLIPWIVRFHRAEGGIALLFALLHPLLIITGFGLSSFLHYRYVTPNLVLYAVMGEVQLFLLFCTAGTALLRKLPWLREHWYTIHFLNYALFVLVWIHSWFIGSDVQTTHLRYLWIFFGLSGLISLILRFLSSWSR